MPTVNQHSRRIKKELSTRLDVRELEFTRFNISGGEDTKSIELPVTVWDNPHPAVVLRKEDEGKSVWIAGYPSTWDVTLEKYYEKGEHDQFPDGGLSLVILDRRAERGVKTRKDCFFEEVVLHPDELDEERLTPYEVVKDGRKA